MFFQQDFQISIKAWEKIGKHSLPYTIQYTTSNSQQTDSNSILISWDVGGIVQKSYILEMRGTTPHLRSDGEIGLPYYNSGKVNTGEAYHHITGALNQNWLGLVEIRLRVFDAYGNEYCTHDQTNDIYEFEKSKIKGEWRSTPQYRLWGIKNEKYYFVLYLDAYNQINFSNQTTMLMDFQAKPNAKIQISNNPLFPSNSNTLSYDNWQMGDKIAFADNQSNIRLRLQSDVMYYYHLWHENSNSYGIHRAFFRTSNTAPQIIVHEIRKPKPANQNSNSNGDADWLTDEQIQRNHGEMVIEITISDSTSNYVNLEASFFLEDNEYPCVISQPLYRLKTNTRHRLLWLTYFDTDYDSWLCYKSIKGTVNSLQVTFRATDDRGMSAGLTTLCRIENSNQQSGTVFTPAIFNIQGKIAQELEYPLYPAQAIQHFMTHATVIDNGTKISRRAHIFCNPKFHIKEQEEQGGGGEESGNSKESWGEKFWQENSSNSGSYAIKIYCPDCIKHFKMQKKWGKVVWEWEIENDTDGHEIYHGKFVPSEDYSGNSGNYYMSYCASCGRYYRYGDGIVKIKTKINGKEKEVTYKNGKYYDIDGVQIKVNLSGNSQITYYCENCGELAVLDVVYPQNSHENFKFHCNNCGKFFNKEMVFDSMHTELKGIIAKQNFSLYHGYSSDDKDNNALSNELLLHDKSQIKKDEFLEILKNADGQELGVKFKGDIQDWGGLRHLKHRARIQPYLWVQAPETLHKNKHALYNDGTTIHFDMERDYLHDYTVLARGEGRDLQEIRLIDECMAKAADSAEWAYMNTLAYKYTISKENMKSRRDWLYPCDTEWMKRYYAIASGYDYRYNFYIVRSIYTMIGSPRRITITQGVNDRYCYIVDGQRKEGSLFGTFTNIFTGEENIPIIPLKNTTVEDGVKKANFFVENNLDTWKNIILALFSDIVKKRSNNGWVANILDRQGNLIRDIAGGDSAKYHYQFLEGVYYLTITQGPCGDELTEYPLGMIESYELVPVEHSCYNAIGVQTFQQERTDRYIGQSDNSGKMPYIIEQPFSTLEEKKHYFFNPIFKPNGDKGMFIFPPSNSSYYQYEVPITNEVFRTDIIDTKKKIFVYKGDDGVAKFGFGMNTAKKQSEQDYRGFTISNHNYENIVLLKRCNHYGCNTYYPYNYQDCTNPNCKDMRRQPIQVGQYTAYPGCFIDVSNSLNNLGGGKLCFAKWTLSKDDNSESYSEEQVTFKKYTDYTVENAEPLFTCNKDEVDINGFHFGYSEEQFKKTKKIYVRTFHGELAYPFERQEKIHSNSGQSVGYRNWVIQEIPGKPGRYRRKQAYYSHGLPATAKPVKIDAEGNTEIAYFDPWGVCISHDVNNNIYTEKKYSEWGPQILARYCIVFDYVDITQAWCKNRSDYDAGRPPFNRKAPVRIKVSVNKTPKIISVDYWGKYYLGPYAYSSQRQRQHYYQWFKSFPEQDDKFVHKKYWINGAEENRLPYPNQHFFSNSDSDGEYMVQRIYTENPGYLNFVPVIDTSNSAETHEYRESNSTVRVKYAKWHSNSQSESISDEDIDKWFYSGEKRCWCLLKKDGWYSLQSTSFDRYSHYDKVWGKQEFWSYYDSSSTAAYAEVTIDPFSPDFRVGIGWVMQNGYQPMNTLENYYIQDRDGIYSKGALIPLGSRYVYDLMKDKNDSFILRGKVATRKQFASDKSKALNMDKYLPLLDYRLKNEYMLSRLKYFSGYPRKWHEAFANRPDIVYEYDNPIRIRGYTNDIREVTTNPRFLYAQGISNSLWTWNGYNRLHWTGSFNDNVMFQFYAVELENQGGQWVEKDSIEIHLKNSVLGDDGKYYFPIENELKISYSNSNITYKDIATVFKYESNSEDVPFRAKKEQTALIDNMDALINSNSQGLLKQNTSYKFKVQYKSGNVWGNPFESNRFVISRDAVSPATILSAEYDKWTGRFTVEFRLDDYYGRKYDVLSVQYTNTVIDDDGKKEVWVDFPAAGLSGEILNLESNMYGDNVAVSSMIITHKLWFDLDVSKLNLSDGIRFKIISALSENRDTMTLPIFTVKMWANEFLKPAEERIKILGGYKNNYVWRNAYYVEGQKKDEAVLIQGHWEYVSNSQAPYVSGKIDDTRALLDQMQQNFQSYYNINAKFTYPDIDAWETYLKNQQTQIKLYKASSEMSSSTLFTFYSQFRYTYDPLFNDFLTANNLTDNYNYYINLKSWSDNLTDEFLKYRQHQGFIEFFSYNSLYDYYLNSGLNRMKYLMAYAHSNSDLWNDFSSKVKIVPEFNEFMFDAINSNSTSRQDFLKLFPSESLVYDPNSLAYEDYFRYRGNFDSMISKYCQTYTYPDTRYFERKQLYNQNQFDYATDTTFVAYLASELPYIALFGTHSDYISAYLSYKGMNNISNTGQLYARSAYMSFKEQGFTRGQRYQYLLNDLENYENEMEIAQQVKIVCETDHRKNLISQGYFCNGFLENQPFVIQSNSNGSHTVINTCFRFRTQTQLYEGTFNGNYQELYDSTSTNPENDALIKKLERFKMYYHIQLDFFDTFDSQNGKPLRDIWYATDPTSATKAVTRIFAAQMDADNSVKSSYYSEVENENTDVYRNKQYISTFSLPWKQMPGQIESDFVPDLYLERGAQSTSLIADYNQCYYWRAASYNIVERPVFDTPQMRLVKPITTIQDTVFENLKKHTAVLKVNFASTEITECNYEYKTHNFQYFVYVATAEIEPANQQWIKNYDRFKPSVPDEEPQYKCPQCNSPDVGWQPQGNKIKIYCDYCEEVYFIDAIEEKYDLLNELRKVFSESSFANTINPFNTDWINEKMLEQGTVQFITDRPRFMSNSNTSFIDDNINNYETSWIPFNPIRHKPSVIRTGGTYLMFTHKTVAKRRKNGHDYNSNVITMSRGFSSDVFGEECTVFPRYSFQSAEDVIEGALSFDNPYIRYDGTMYYLYFNVLFFENNNFVTRIYRAISSDLDVWHDFKCVTEEDNAGVFPCVVKTPQDYYLMFVAKDNEMYCYYNFEQSNSESDLTFTEKEKIRVYTDFGNISAISAIYKEDTVYMLYFSINGNIYYSEFNYSELDGVSNNVSSNMTWLNAMQMQTISKSFDSNSENTHTDDERVSTSDTLVDYSNYCFNPCVIEDDDYGTPILRLFYNTYNHPFVWVQKQNATSADEDDELDKKYIQDMTHYEIVINTRYLEKYQWKKVNIMDSLTIHTSGHNTENDWIPDYNTWTYRETDIPFYPMRYADTDTISDSDSTTYTMPLLWYEGQIYPIEVQQNYIHLNWLDDNSDVLAIKVLINPVNNKIYAYSQSRWIDFNNINQTQAMLRPEYPDISYDVNNYRASDYMVQREDLMQAFNKWITGKSYDDDEEAYMAFLKQTHRYSGYIKWSRRGQGIYYYNSNIVTSSWQGKDAII